MAKSNYGATFPKVVIDESVNYPNAQYNVKSITVEEWNDLLHHTHVMHDILDNNGEFIGKEVASNIIEGAGGGSQGGGSGSASSQDVEDLKSKIESLESQLEAVTSRLAQLEQSSGDGGIIIGDYDVETPGIQGPNG